MSIFWYIFGLVHLVQAVYYSFFKYDEDKLHRALVVALLSLILVEVV